MGNSFDDFDLDIQKLSPTPEAKPAALPTTTFTLPCIIYTAIASCFTCIEVGKTSDQCTTDNCTKLSNCYP